MGCRIMGNILRRLGCLCFISFPFLLEAQQVASRPLITRPIDETQLTTVRGSTHPLARPEFDLGIAPPDLPMERMLLVLKRDPQQDYSLHKLLDNQQDKASPNYHKWLTPDEFGAQFGPSDQDIQQVTGWLQGHGFQVNRVSRGRSVIEFSGMESQVESALHTQIHQYLVKGENHWANSSDPQIPAALAPVVAGVWSLHDFKKQPRLAVGNHGQSLDARSWGQANLTSGKHALMPADYATIYNINPVYASGVDGRGTTIAIVARSEIDGSDFDDFKILAGMTFPQLTITPNGPDPGFFSLGEQFEATLDATWSSAVAPAANINFVVSASTNTTDGVDLSELYIIDNNVGDVMTESFSSCESGASQQEANAVAALAEQAAAEGITYMVSSGDSGAEGCLRPSSLSANGSQPAVNILSSTPFTVAVGGTMFNENNQNSTYWNATNAAVGLDSAKSYIPENVWNESCGNCGLWSGGGGASVLFSKPNWQFGVQGIPADSARDVPDVSLTAAVHDAYILCFQRSCANNQIFLVGGTSASAPSFAGIMALIVQQYGRQGQANYVLYRLAASETLWQCNGSGTSTHPSSACIFNDVTKGNNAVPGELNFGTTLAKYQAGTGYDLATGLGSVNVSNLVTKWGTVTFNSTNTTLAPGSIAATHGSPVSLSVSVAPGPGGSGVPTGDVSLATGGVPSNPGFLTLSNGSVTGSVNDLPGGSYSLTARYGGDANFAPSTSSGVAVHITPENSTTTVSVLSATSNGAPIPFSSGPYGSFVYLRTDVTANSGHGTATGSISLSEIGGPLLGGFPLNSEGNGANPYGFYTFSPGVHHIQAQYSGDSSLNPSTSAAASFTITQATTTTSISSSASKTALGTNINLTAVVATNGFGQIPGGAVNFFSGNLQIGTAFLFSSTPSSTGVNSQAILSIANLPIGQDTITAQYVGDGNYIGSSSGTVSITVDGDFTISPANSSVHTSQGSSATNTLTVTGQTGYNSTINFTSVSCSGLPRLSSCSFAPASVAGSGTTVLTIRTTAATSAALVDPGFGFSWPSISLVFSGIVLLGIRRRRHASRSMALLAVGLVLGLGLSGCGGGSGGGGGGGGGGNPGTPKGSYPVTVTATTTDQVVSHAVSFTLVVQ